MAGDKTWLREKTLNKIEDTIATANGLGIADIVEETGLSTQTIVEDLRILVKQGRVTKGLKKNMRKDGTFTGNLGPAYYAE